MGLRKIIDSGEIRDYEVPFLLMLCGEYVVEILIDAYDGIKLIDGELLNEYIASNYSKIELIEARMISYWSEYYRKRSYGVKYNRDLSEWNNYIGHSILGIFKNHGYMTKR